MDRKTKIITLSENKKIYFETGKIAKQANGAVLVRLGDTIVFATACAAPRAEEGGDFLPLRIDYQEKFFSAGKTLGGFIKREGRPTEREILVSRFIDRPLRPMFEEGYFNEVQILAYVWSYDGLNLPDPLAICAASAALAISDIPLIKPIAGVRVGYVDKQFIINPTAAEMKASSLDLILSGTEDAILMIEGYCDFLTEEQVIQAIETGQHAIRLICAGIQEWHQEVGKPKNREDVRPLSSALLDEIEKATALPLQKAIRIPIKRAREASIDAIQDEILTQFALKEESAKYSPADIKTAFKKISSKYLRRLILDEGIRADGRGVKDIRNIDVELGLLPRTHGNCLFTRGETQTMAVCTLGG